MQTLLYGSETVDPLYAPRAVGKPSAGEDAVLVQVLIIDDNADDREGCIRALRRVREARYAFAEAEDGDSGLAAIAAHSPDIVLVDFSLPGPDGVDVLARIVETDRFLPVILLTGQGNEAVAVRGMKAGAVDYVTKSNLASEALHKAILAAIENRRAARMIEIQRRTIQRQRENMEDQNRFLHCLLDHIPDPVFVKDGAHRWLLVNEAFREVAHASSWGAPSPAAPEGLTGEDSKLWKQDDQALAAAEATVSEQCLADPAGVRRLFSIKRAAFPDRAGGKILVGVMRDITEQRRSQEEFKKQAATLMSQSQDLAGLGAILDDSLQEIYIFDAVTLHLIQVNRGALGNLGYTRAEVEQMRMLDIQPQFTEQQLRQALAPLMTSEQAEIVYHSQHRRKSGSSYDVEVHTQIAFFQRRTVFVQIALDETERKRMENMKREFISTVSHELRTPLTSILGALGLLHAGALGSLPDGIARMIRVAHSNAERLAQLVNDILALEKSAAGRLRLQIAEIQVAEFLQHAVESNAAYGEQHNVRFAVDPVAPGLAVHGDRGRMLQVMANLLSNAAKFSPSGATVRIRAAAAEARVRFEVEDDGVGIPAHFRQRVFERFAQAESSIARRFEGTGLGLSITRQLVEAMGGNIGFESEPGRGSLFYFDLPRPGDWLDPLQADPEKRVLICEDDPDIALLMKLAIEQAGFETDVAPTIRDARRKLKDRPFAVLTLDLMMPDASGMDFLKALRAEKVTARLPVIVVSALQGREGQTIGEQPAVTDWIVKPVDHRTLVESVRKAALGAEALPYVLYLGENPALKRQLLEALSDKARMIACRDLAEVYRQIRLRKVDLIVVDSELGSLAGELGDHLQSREGEAPEVLLLPPDAPDGALETSHESLREVIGLALARLPRPGPSAG
jgi:PAS domain S-box-containing protein